MSMFESANFFFFFTLDTNPARTLFLGVHFSSCLSSHATIRFACHLIFIRCAHAQLTNVALKSMFVTNKL